MHQECEMEYMYLYYTENRRPQINTYQWINKCRWIKREIDKLSKGIKNSEEASYSSIESINSKPDDWSLIPMTTPN